jgi:hypothetical protein
MTVPTQRADWRTALLLFRDDGPLARALGRMIRGRAGRVPAPLPLLIAPLPLLVVMILGGDDASHGAVAAAVGFAVLAGGISRGASHGGRLAWLAPPLLRALEYSAIIAIAAVSSEHAPAAAYALIAAVAFRHYDLVYRLRQRGETPPDWVGLVGLGWDGRLVVAVLLLLTGALPAGFYVLAALFGAVFVTEAVAGWAAFARSGRRMLEEDDEEDEDA